MQDQRNGNPLSDGLKAGEVKAWLASIKPVPGANRDGQSIDSRLGYELPRSIRVSEQRILTLVIVFAAANRAKFPLDGNPRPARKFHNLARQPDVLFVD